jgi:ribosome biogenesis GTPase A
MADEEDTSETGPLRSVGNRLGDWARRVGTLVADAAGRPTIAEAVREPLAKARAARLTGDREAALESLRKLSAEHADDAVVRLELALTLIHDLVAGGRPLRPLEEAADFIGEALGRGVMQLLHGAAEVYQGRPDRALDSLRRAAGDLSRLPDPIEEEARFFVHLLAGIAQLRQGNEERALREFRKCRARFPEGSGEELRIRVLSYGVELALSAGETTDADAWIREALAQSPDRPELLELLCRTLAAKGDRVGAHAMLEYLDEPQHDPTRVFVGLAVGLPDDAPDDLPAVAMRNLQADAESTARRRDWALALLAGTSTPGGETLEAGLVEQLLEALVDVAAAAPKATKDRYLQELAHAMLRLDAFPSAAIEAIRTRLSADPATAPEELRLVRTRVAIAAGEPADDEFTGREPPRFRADPDIGGPWGPDPKSPVRNPDIRSAVLGSQRALAAAELCIANEQPELAQDLLVESLVEWPAQHRARSLLASLVAPASSHRLEDLLSAATQMLAAVPNRILGASMEGVQTAMNQVVAARERLVRPLTIAIMGEFSAGKSTFVNALLGEAVAPMGVLPTTTTINVFRRGIGRGARVHYRDDRISLISDEQIQDFLHGLDDTDAAQIRHVEIERTGKRMGDAAVVDTPGLNALDEYHEQVAREFLDEADAVVWVFSATRSGAASEVGMLTELRESGRQVLGILNKVDTLDKAEKKELAEYLREQLGEVLVDVVPLQGTQALEWRTSKSPQGADPFAPVDDALEEHFLTKARELKRSLTARRLTEALALARQTCMTTIEALEQRAREADGTDPAVRPGASLLLQRFADRLEPGLLGVDDVLVREGLGLGVLETGKGLAKGPLDPLDGEYLGACVRDAAMAALQRALVEVAAEDTAASEVLDRAYVPWARGHLDGLIAAGFIDQLLDDNGEAISEGETAARKKFRAALQPIVVAWIDHAKSMTYEVERAQRRSDRATSSAPRAEAMRLRSAVVASIDALTQAVQESDA